MTLDTSIEHILQLAIPKERIEILQTLIDYIQAKKEAKAPIRLNFICTHNSRRSQFSQVWAAVAAHAFGIETTCLSGGVEVTEFNSRAVDSLKRMGFVISSSGTQNPKYAVEYALRVDTLTMFSKRYDDTVNQVENFAAIMTCDHADENCPFIPGSEQRISVQYIDPKAFDNTLEEVARYDERSFQIASEMFYVFSKIK
ncbi:MAG: arsenate reductase [Halieaceae bacterium]|jgi:arsenate reductase